MQYSKQLHHLLPTTLAAAIAAGFGSVLAAPMGAATLPTSGQVVAGQASISQPAANALQVRQDSANAVIDWRSFNIGREASVVFQQPSTRSAVLNRVTGPDASHILGRLQANGQVFLINPYGMVFGREARVDVAGLVASTANIRNDDFMAGRLRFDTPGQIAAQIINEGDISVREGGLAAFMAPGVANHGTITARLGTLALASGDAFTLDPYGDKLIQWVIPASQLARVVNSGTLSADGGSVQISTRTATAVVDGLINLGGVVQARSVAERGGRIVLEGDAHSTVAVTGQLDVSGLAAGDHGGVMQVHGKDIQLAASAQLNARGDVGGGTVHLGGGWQGTGGRGTVSTTTVERGATIDASAVSQGQGGQAVVWSDGLTRFDGHITARGGAHGGDGGQVEVSGRHLRFNGQVDAAASQGAPGNLLLDPGSLRLQSSNTAAIGQDDIVTTEAINGLLSTGTSVHLSASEDITVVDHIDARLVSANGQRLNRMGANLSLNAGGHLKLNNFVILDGGSFNGIAGKTITQQEGASLVTGGGDVNLSAGSGITLDGLTGVRHLTLNSQQGDIVLAKPVTLSGRFSADITQAIPGNALRLNGLFAASDNATPAVAIHRAAGNTGAASVVLAEHLIARGDVSIQGASVSLADGKAVDTRAVSGGRAGAAITIDAGANGLTLGGIQPGGVYADDAVIRLTSQGDYTQGTGAVVANGNALLRVEAAGTALLTQLRTAGTLQAEAAQLRFAAGTTDTAVSAGTLTATAHGTTADAINVANSLRVGNGGAQLTSAGGVTMQPHTVIEAGANGSLRIQASQDVILELLKSEGAGVFVKSDQGNVLLRRALGGRAPSDPLSVITAGGDTVPQPTLYALDVRAPNGRIDTQGLLLYGLKGTPIAIDMPAAGELAYGLNLDAARVFLRGLVFVLDGAVSVRGSQKVVLGNSVRSANGHPMTLAGGEINLYRPQRPDGSDYRNTDIVVGQYVDSGGAVTYRFFEQLNGAWQQSTSFVSVIMPDDLPAPSVGALPTYWLDRTQAHTGIATVALTDPNFAISGAAPVRLVSLPDVTPAGTNAFVKTTGLASYDPLGGGRHPFVPLIYRDTNLDPADLGQEAIAIDQVFRNFGNVPGTRFVPKILITNDPGPNFVPQTMPVAGGGFITRVGRVTLDGPVYETDANGARIIHDVTGVGFESAGDLRNVALKVVSFDTRALFQDSKVSINAGFGGGGTCSSLPGSCADDPLFPSNLLVGEYPRMVYPSSFTKPRNRGAAPADSNPVSDGFQAKAYLFTDCLNGDCERPITTNYQIGEQPKPNVNPNAPTTSLVWRRAQPGIDSGGRFELLEAYTGSGFNPQAPALRVEKNVFDDFAARDVFRINVNLTQTGTVSQQGTAGASSRVTLVVGRGVLGGTGVRANSDGQSLAKTTLPQPASGSVDTGSAPVFSTILPGNRDTTLALASVSSSGTVPAATITSAAVLSPGGLLNGVLPSHEEPMNGPASDSANDTQRVVITAASAPGLTSGKRLLVLGGRGAAQTADLGRSGGLSGVDITSSDTAYEVACGSAGASGHSGDAGLPACP